MFFPAAFPIRDAIAPVVRVVNLTALGSPCPILPEGAYRQQNMGVWVAGSLVMDGKVCAHSSGHKAVPDFSENSTLFRRVERFENSGGAWAVQPLVPRHPSKERGRPFSV